MYLLRQSVYSQPSKVRRVKYQPYRCTVRLKAGAENGTTTFDIEMWGDLPRDRHNVLLHVTLSLSFSL